MTILNKKFKQPLREREIEQKVIRYARKRGFLFYKFISPNNRGVPDRIFITPDGKIFFIEFKCPGGKPSNLQLHVFDKLKSMNCKVYVVDDPEQGCQIIDEYK